MINKKRSLLSQYGVRQAPKVKTHKTVVLEDSMIASILRDGRFIKEFPGLSKVSAAVAKVQGRRCGRCGAKNRNRGVAFSAVKNHIVSLSPEKRQKFKSLLAVDEVQIYFHNAATGKLDITTI